jgi:hypothetical protein
MAIELENCSPAASTTGVRRDWSLTVDVIDTTYGVDSGVVLTIDGTAVTTTETTITNGYRVEYEPSASASYGQRITAKITATPTGETAESTTWRFTIETADTTEASSSTPPYVSVARDVGLSSDEADETDDNGTNLVWLDSVTDPLIVTEAQAETVGTVEIDAATYHVHQRTLKVLREDSNGDLTASLQVGDLIQYSCDALGETDQKAEVMAISGALNKKEGDTLYTLIVQYYEACYTA